jgi:branched-chain amino acid aminotransferase
MPQPLAYRNGRLIPVDELSLPVYDAGFVLGITVTEQLRTFGGKLFRLDAHLDRMFRSLEVVRVDPGCSRADLDSAARELVAHNHALLAEGDDLGLCVFVTPGPMTKMAPAAPRRPTVCMHTFPVAFSEFAALYDKGESLAIPGVRQVSSAAWPRELKCRSRMHYYLADLEAGQIAPGARAVLLDDDGHVTEATTANVLIHEKERGLVSPPHDKILPGISVATVKQLATDLGMPLAEQDLTPQYMISADEVLLTSTSPCVLPVTRLDGQPVGGGRPGPVFAKLLAAWSELVGVDIAAQAKRFADRC